MRTLRTVLVSLIVLTCMSAAQAFAAAPKYVFLFIGDGMASPQIHAAEAYLKQLLQPDNPDGLYEADGITPASLGTAGSQLLLMSRFPVTGMQRSYADNRFITGSAASATALACGKKSSINTIAMDPTKTANYLTIAEAAKQRGMKVGVVSSVSIDHATPACFYAHEADRGSYWHIANQLSESGFDYFGGGGMKGEKTKYWPDGASNPVTLAIQRGYTVVSTRAALQGVQPGTKTFAYSENLDSEWALPYDIDRPASDLSLAEFTAEGIRLLDNRRGFFMMVEAGKIDWACHANDAKAAIMDTIAFDQSIREAVKFYLQHPTQTLIVVTGDHECGGMTLGFAGTKYETAFELLQTQTMSYEAFDAQVLANHKSIFAADPWNDATDIPRVLWVQIEAAFGLAYEDLSDYELELMEAAYDRTMGADAADTEEDYLNYGGYEPLTVTLTHILNRKAGFAWTSYSHTAVPVPVYALGAGASLFDGYYENTEVANRIARAMRVSLND